MTTINLVSPIHHNRIKLERAIASTKGTYNFTAYHSVFDSIMRDDNKHLLAVSEVSPELLSYAQNENHRYDSGRRVNTTIQRYLRRTFKTVLESATDATLEAIASYMLVDILPIDYGFSIVSGTELESSYKVGPRSCMSGSDSDKVRLWANNPKHISLLVLHEKEKLVGRCLIWGGDHYDTIYCSSYNGRDRFAKYLAYHNYKPAKGARLKFTLNDTNNELYPYADTLRNVKRMPSGRIIVRSYDGYNPDGLLNSTTGDYPTDEETVCCADCGERVHQDDTTYIEASGDTVCEYCLANNYTYLEYRGEYAHDDNVVSDINGDNTRTDDITCNCDQCDAGIRGDQEYILARDSNGREVTVCEVCQDNCNLVECPCCNVMILID